MVNEFWKRPFNATVSMEFRVCFSFAKYENATLSLCETTNVLIDAFSYSKIHFHQFGSFKLIKNNVKSLNVMQGLSQVWNRYPKGSQNTCAPYRSIIAYDELKDRICKE